MKKLAFSLIEVIVSLFITLAVFIPIIKINYKQLYNFKSINTANSELNFFNSVLSFLENNEIFLGTDKKFKFKNFKDIKKEKVFQEFDLYFPLKEDFDMSVSFKYEDIDFYTSKKASNIIEINFSNKNKKLQAKILKFKE